MNVHKISVLSERLVIRIPWKWVYVPLASKCRERKIIMLRDFGVKCDWEEVRVTYLCIKLNDLPKKEQQFSDKNAVLIIE